jgi:tetratricopeptide (TPR) repeat protein
MIVKDEADTLEQTIQSVRDHVDEVIIGVDEASNDGTREIAERLADRVIPHYLDEELAKQGPRKNKGDWGFSKARNRVLAVCKPGTWRLILDGHETVKNPENIHKVIEEAESKNQDGVEVWIHFEPDQYGIPQLMYTQARLLGPNIRYQNSQHNAPMLQKHKKYVSEQFVVEHNKQHQNKSAKKARDVQRSKATIEGFEDAVKQNPQDSRSWFYLGNAYKENAKWTLAIEAYKEYLLISKWDEERWHARVNMGTCYSYRGERDNAREQFVKAIEEFPPMAEAYYYMADLAYKQQHYHEAQVWLEHCVKMEMPKCRLFVTPRIYMVDRYDLLSMVYNHLKQYEKAIQMAEKAYETAEIPRIKNNIEIWSKWISR